MVAVLHVAVAARRVSLKHGHPRQATLLAWRAPAETQNTLTVEDETPSNPTQAYCIGTIALTNGMAVVILATWLHIMRMTGAPAN